MTVPASAWRKTPASRLLVSIDWRRQLNGATISGAPTITPDPRRAGLTCTYQGTTGTVQSFWLAGDPGADGATINVAIATSSGEQLDIDARVLRM